jgi:HK97 family phage prohead protease
MSSDALEYKATSLGSFESKGAGINLDEAQGIVECFVSGIGNKDSVGDIVSSGAFTKSLMRRKPRVVWGHNWNDPIGKVLEIYEVPSTDNRLPLKMKMAGIGGLFARVQFNLQSEKGREAFANVAFFGEEQEWSIGYKTLRAQYDQKSQANVIFELELYEVSPVLHGANQLTGTISVKSDMPSGTLSSMNEEDMTPLVSSPLDREEIEKQLGLMLGSKVSIMDVTEDEVTFAKPSAEGVKRYKCHYGRNNGQFMFGPPRQFEAPSMHPTSSPAMPMPPNQPQRIVRPSQMPSMPIAVKPGHNGITMVPLPAVRYEENTERQKPFDPANLDQEETDLRDALLKITKRHGKFNEDSDGVWAAYTPASRNEVASIGVKCANCVFFQGGNSCKIIDMEIESEGKCRFAVIPKGVVTGDVVVRKSAEYGMDIDQENYLHEIEYKFPNDLAVTSLRGAIGRSRRARRKYKDISEFGMPGDEYDGKSYCLPVMPDVAFKVKQALDPIFDFHGAETFVDPDGIVFKSGVSLELIEAIDTALDNLKKKSLSEGLEEKAGYRLGRAIGSRMVDRPSIGGERRQNRIRDINFTTPGARRFNPFTAVDKDRDGMVGDEEYMMGRPLIQNDPTPNGPGSVNNPTPSRAQIAEEAKKPKAPAKPAAGAKKKTVSALEAKLSPEYDKYLAKPINKRSEKENLKFNGPLYKYKEGDVLSSGRVLERGDMLEEESPELKEFYANMTQQMIEMLSEIANNPNKKNWTLPWRDPEHYARNPITGRVYQGSNQLTLMLTAKARGYEVNRWAGASQWKRLKGKISKDARPMPVLVPMDVQQVDILGNEFQERKYKVEIVYNIADVLGLPEEMYKGVDVNQISEEERLQNLEDVIKEIGPSVKETSGSSAFYRPSTDAIHMPAFSQFNDSTSYYATLMHETVHWTAHPSRLDRKEANMAKKFGDEYYAFEELVAEIGAAFALGSMGITPTIREDHAIYVSGWMEKLKTDPTALHRALTQAQQANDYLLNKSATMRRLAGIPDEERKGKRDVWTEVPGIMGYADSPLVPPTNTIYGPIEDLYDIDEIAIDPSLLPDPDGELSYDEKLITATEFRGDVVKTGRDGSVIGADGRLSSGKDSGPIRGVEGKEGVPEVKRGDRSISYRRVFKLKVEPTAEQKDILDLTLHLIRNKDPRVVSVLAGAGTGKTTTLKNIAWALEREFDVPDSGEARIEHLKYLTDRYGISFDKMSVDEVNAAVKELAKKYEIGDMYYAVFGKKNQQEAELEFPGNTGVATTSKMWYWSLALGQGDEKYGKEFRRKLSVSKMSRDGSKTTNLKKNPAAATDPDAPPLIPHDYTETTFDGKTETFSGRKPGFEELGWRRLDDGSNWKEFLKLADRADKIIITRQEKVKGGKKDQVQEVKMEGFRLPNGAEVTVDEFGDLFNKAMRRWSLSADEKATKEMFTLSEVELEQNASEKGKKKIKTGEISPVDADFEVKEVPQEWVDMLQGAIDEVIDRNSNMLPTREMGPKLWMMTNPDLRTDPGLIGHSATSLIINKTIPNTYGVGDTYEIDGVQWVVSSVSKPSKANKGTHMAKLAKPYATKDKPLSAFFVDEGQDSNPIIEEVLKRNRENLPIILVGDDRQGVFAFNNAKNILASMEPDYELEITQSFRYGDTVGHLGNLVLAKQNIYLTSQGVPQPPWKHVKGEAQNTVYKNFDDLLPEDVRVLKDLPELSPEERREKILHVERTYSTPDRQLDIVDLPLEEQTKALLSLRDELAAPKAGRIVDADEEIKKGNLPTMILTRSNRQIIKEASAFLMAFLASPSGKDKDGKAILPEIIIPAQKHKEMIEFAEHLKYIFLSPSQRKDYEAKRGGRPVASSIIGPVWTRGEVTRKLNQSQYTQLRTMYKLIMEKDPNDPNSTALGVNGLLTLLNGAVKRETDDKGKSKLRVIPPTLIAERETLTLPKFAVSVDQVKNAANAKTVKKNVRAGQDNQLEKFLILPPSDNKDKHGVYAQLEIIGGSEKSPGKATGKIFITGDGADTGRPTILADGTEKPISRKGNGRYRRDLEKAIERLGLTDKVKPGEQLAHARADRIDRSYDGFVIDAGSIEENSKILAQLGDALREAARTTGGDVEITTAQLAKGRESRFVKLAEDFMDPMEVFAEKPQGMSAINWMEETNLVYVALTRAQEMIDPGSQIFKIYLADNVTENQRKEMAAAAKRGDLPEDLDKGAFADGKISLPEKYKAINEGRNTAGSSPEEDNEKIVIPDSIGETEEIDDVEIPTDEEELVLPEGEENIDDVIDQEDESEILDSTDDGEEDDNIDDFDAVLEEFDGLSSGRASAASASRLSSGQTGGRSSRRVSRSGRVKTSGGRPSPRMIAGFRLSGQDSEGNPTNPANSPRLRRALGFAMNVWDEFRKTGIVLDTDSQKTSMGRRDSIKTGMNNVKNRIGKKPNISVGNVLDNERNENPSAATWMLSVDKLRDTIRIPTEYSVVERYGEFSGQRDIAWTQSRPISVEELADMLSLDGENAKKLGEPNAGISHDAVRTLIGEIGREEAFPGWKLFSPVTPNDKVTEIDDAGEEVERALTDAEKMEEVLGRANMRDRFIVETFGSDAYPFWWDTDESRAMTPEEYRDLGEVSAASKFMAGGMFDKDDPVAGDSEIEADYYLEGFEGVDIPAVEENVTAEEIKADKTSRKDFELSNLLGYLGISRDEWAATLRERLKGSFGMEDVGLSSVESVKSWENDGVPIAYINHMIKTGVIPSAGTVWGGKTGSDGKKTGPGIKLDTELSRKKYIVFQALADFMDRSAPGKVNRTVRKEVSGETGIDTLLDTAKKSKGTTFSPRKGDEARFSDNQLQEIVNRFNERFDTNYTIEDIFSAEQLEAARKKIEEAE